MKAPIAGLVVSTVAFAGSSAYLWAQLNEERARATEVAALTRRLNERITELERLRGHSDHQRLAAAPENLTPGPASVVPEASNAVAIEGTTYDYNRPDLSPGYLKMMRAQYRANTRRTLSELGEELKLRDDEEKKLLDLLTDHQIENMNRSVEAATSGKPDEQWKDRQREQQEQIVELIGAERAEELHKYQESLPARSEVEMIANQLEGSDTPLKDEQRKRLVAAVSEEKGRVPMPEFNVGGDQMAYARAANDWQEDYERRVNAQARTILNSEQYNAYSEYQQWQREMRDQWTLSRTADGSGDTMFFIGTNVATPTAAVRVPAPDPPQKK